MTSSSLPEVDYTVAFPDGPEGRWLVLSYQSSEELSGDCNAVLDLATDDAAPDLSAFLGSTCELMMARADGPARYFYGVVLRVDLLGRVEHRLVLRVHVVSAFELGRQRRHSRIWQGVSTLDVVSEVLDELLSSYGRTYDATALSRGSEPRTYCVQFRETDFDFVKRLLEEEGISYCFVHHPDAGHEVLTLCDDNEQYESIENLDGSSAFPLIAVNPDQAEFESIQGLEWSQQLTSTAVLRRDYVLTAEREAAEGRVFGLAR